MLQSYVGIASSHGLNALFVENAETLRLVGRAAPPAGQPRVGFWAVMLDQDARRVAALLREGERREALRLLDRTVQDIGRLFPTPQTEGAGKRRVADANP